MSPGRLLEVPDTASIKAIAQHGITQYGFLPSEEPLQRLPHPYYTSWENAIGAIAQLVETEQLRQEVHQLPVLSTIHLHNDREWQRAYVILSFLTHGYVWAGDTPSDRLPPQISIPLLAVSKHLGLPPVATYAALNLWNWRTTSSCLDNVILPDCLASLHTLTGTLDEAWFYLISVSVEARGAPIIPTMLRANDAVEGNNSSVVIQCLEDFSTRLQDLESLLSRMYEQCDPRVFYHQIRPFLAGSKNMAAAGLPNGLFYSTSEFDPTEGEWLQYRGGSNAQSSLIQFFDVVLGVKHHSEGADIAGKGAEKDGFHKEMRMYMPRQHREFLEYVEQITNIREYVLSNPTNKTLLISFNNAIAALTSFRNVHVQMVTRYIIIPSKDAGPHTVKDKVNLATASTKERTATVGMADREELHGTGGTALIPFLRQTRDETINAAV